MFRLPFMNKNRDDAVPMIYQQLIQQARDPWFYTAVGVADSQQGRFEVICVHMYMLLERLKAHKRFSQQLFDYFFHDMDRNLRELGVGDLSVGKKIASMLTLFYNKIEQYQANTLDFKPALVLFFKDKEFLPDLMNLYIKQQRDHLLVCPDDSFLKGQLTWYKGNENDQNANCA